MRGAHHAICAALLVCKLPAPPGREMRCTGRSCWFVRLTMFAHIPSSLLAGLPFALAKAGVDPANAGTSIQVCTSCGRCASSCLPVLCVCNSTRVLLPDRGCNPSAPSGQVIMDITGVLITCATCHLVLDQLAAGLKVA